MSPGVGASISLTGFELQCRSSPSYFWNKITHAKTQRGHVYPTKWLQQDIDRPLTKLHGKLNYGRHVQF